VVYIVAARRAMQSITNIFIANLAVSDVIMCLLAVPFTPISGLLQSWPFGEALCHLVPMTMRHVTRRRRHVDVFTTLTTLPYMTLASSEVMTS